VGLWQLAQACLPEADMAGSKNSALPNAVIAGTDGRRAAIIV